MSARSFSLARRTAATSSRCLTSASDGFLPLPLDAVSRGAGEEEEEDTGEEKEEAEEVEEVEDVFSSSGTVGILERITASPSWTVARSSSDGSIRTSMSPRSTNPSAMRTSRAPSTDSSLLCIALFVVLTVLYFSSCGFSVTFVRSLERILRAVGEPGWGDMTPFTSADTVSELIV
jgi:hypothetical protein